MPKIAYFLGIAISMYHRDHNPPHIHVSYQGFKALIEIRGGSHSRSTTADGVDGGARLDEATPTGTHGQLGTGETT
jgi:hypothetical protein